MHVDENPNLVEVMIAGDKIKQFEMAEDSKLIDDCMWLLEKFMKKSMKRPMNMKRSRWLTNENFLGSYSHPSLTSDTKSIQNLAEPLFSTDDKLALLFAGEATDETFQGYVHGAMRSGWRAAQELIDYCVKSK